MVNISRNDLNFIEYTHLPHSPDELILLKNCLLFRPNNNTNEIINKPLKEKVKNVIVNAKGSKKT